ncbi:TPA: hypothetical protein DF272_02395 [Candidatus Falkowbacteria bacterium]|nr:hypothetical protein [Candidatus Falkowbacteria bacterium]
MPAVLLHTCCAPCGGFVIKELQTMGYAVTVFYYNPNVFPEDEYKLRLREAERFCQKENVELIEGEYDYESWKEKIRGHESAPERGSRCEICITLRLQETAQVASERGFDAIASTLTISPHKSAEMVNAIGHEMADLYGLQFIDRIWRKANGFKKSCDLAEQEHFHRQDYCGCEFSIRSKPTIDKVE